MLKGNTLLLWEFSLQHISGTLGAFYLPKERKTFRVVFEMIGELTTILAFGFLLDTALETIQRNK